MPQQPSSAIQVTPQQLTAAGARLETAGGRLRDTAGRYTQTSGGLPAACGDGQAGAACQEMGAAWSRALTEAAEGLGQLGVLVRGGGISYRRTDETAIPEGFTRTAVR